MVWSESGMSESNWLINAALKRVALQARGPAVPLAQDLVNQIPHFIALGMPIENAVRESLLIAIHSAQIRVQHCVGSERHALDDFIETCLKIESETGYLVNV
jgi:hypothetical protein